MWYVTDILLNHFLYNAIFVRKTFHYSFKPHHLSTTIFLGERKILVNTITLTFYGTTQNSPLKLLSGKSFKHWNYFLHTQFFHIFLFIFCTRFVKIKLEWMSDRRRLNENSPQRKRKRKYPFAHWNDPRIQINSTKTSPIIVNFHVVVCRQRKNMWKFYF